MKQTKHIFFMILLSFCMIGGITQCLHSGEAPAKAKNVILIIGDGMGTTHMQLYYYYAHTILQKKTAFEQIMNEGSTGIANHQSISGLVTDSAASGTAISSGYKTKNGMVGMDADNNVHANYLEIAKRFGKKTAIVTDIPPFDATEAAFTAHAKSRSEFENIVRQTFAKSKPTLVFGKYNATDQNKINDIASQNDYKVIQTKEELSAIQPGTSYYGVFDVTTPFTNNPAPQERKAITLSELTASALRYLDEPSDKGFFMMVEAAQIDKFSHPNDAGSVLRHVQECDRVAGVALDFARSHPDTLVLVTADHETGGLHILSGCTEANLKILGQQKTELKSIRAKLKTSDVQNIQNTFKELAGIPVSVTEAERISNLYENWKKAYYNEPVAEKDTDREPTDADIADATVTYDKSVSAIFEKYTLIGFKSTNHTSSPVIITGFGPGHELCNGWKDNTDVFNIMMQASGLTRE